MPDRSWALQRKLLRAPNIGFNAEVYRHFRDAEDSDAPGRKALRDSLLIQAKESRTSADFKIRYFDRFVLKSHIQETVYGEPIYEIDAKRKYKPQITLFFGSKNDRDYSINKRTRGRASFRLMDETSETITEAKLKTIANKINAEFVTGTLFKYEKGKELYTYREIEKGYDFQIYSKNKTEAKKVITSTMKIQNDTPNWKYLVNHTPEEPTELYPTNPGTISIMGTSYKKGEKRPIVEVYFRYAYAQIQHLGQPVALVDTVGRLLRPYIRA